MRSFLEVLLQTLSQRVFLADTKPSTSERTLLELVRPHHGLLGIKNRWLTCEIAIIHAILFLVGIGYAQNYYFHLSKYARLNAMA